MNDYQMNEAVKKLGLDEMPASVSVDDNGVLHVKSAMNGRRALRAAVQATWKILAVNPDDTSRFAKVGPRKARRLPLRGVGIRRIGKNFRPIYAHAIPVTPDHKSVIRAMKVKNRRTAAKWLASRAVVTPSPVEDAVGF